MMKKEKSCGAVVYQIRDENLYFLIEHMKLGHVSIPKGHVEGTETEEETAIREIREETNLEVRLDTVFRQEVWYSPFEGITKQVVFFAAEAVSAEMKNQECEVSSLEWMPYDRAISAVTYGTDKDVLSHAAVYLGIRHRLHVDRRLLELDDSGSGIWYREHAADIHSHTIFGVDDGAQSPDEAVDLLRLDWEEGARVVFATPHYGSENGYAPDQHKVWCKFNELSEKARKAVPGMQIMLGSEWYCAEDIVDRIRRQEAWPMMPSEWHMVEFLEYGDTSEPGDVMLRRLKNLKENGIKTILAHPERYTAIQQDWNLAKQICDLGVLLQVNAYDLFLNKNDSTRNLAQWMATEELISFIGSDMHGTRPGARRPRLKEGINWLYQNVEYEYACDVVRRNAEKYLQVEKLPIDEDLRFRRRNMVFEK